MNILQNPPEATKIDNLCIPNKITIEILKIAMHVSLTPTLEAYTRQKVQSGLYNNASEVIREALRLMVEQDQKKQQLTELVSAGFKQIEKGKFSEVSNREGFKALARSDDS
jgi:antitoxin ParD1/3/4